MSYGLCEIVDCAVVQKKLDEAFLTANNMQPENLPFLNYVMSAENRAASNIELTTNRSKKHTVQVIYDQPLLTSQVKTNGSGCTATREECDTYQTYTFDENENIYLDLTLSPSDLVGTCEENSAFIARKVQKMITALKETLSENLAASVAGQLGGWSADTANIDGTNLTAGGILQVNTTLDGTPRIPNTALFEQISRALEMSRIYQAGVFGGNDLVSFMRRAMAGGTDYLGYDLMQMLAKFGVGTAYDRHLAAELASVKATNLAVGIGAIAPVGFSLYENEANKMADSTNIADTIYDPATGIKFDYRMQRLCDDWNIQIRATYQFYTWPDDLYQVGSNFYGVKSLAGIEVTCNDLQPCAS
jgi:hypothetical protein